MNNTYNVSVKEGFFNWAIHVKNISDSATDSKKGDKNMKEFLSELSETVHKDLYLIYNLVMFTMTGCPPCNAYKNKLGADGINGKEALTVFLDTLWSSVEKILLTGKGLNEEERAFLQKVKSEVGEKFLETVKGIFKKNLNAFIVVFNFMTVQREENNLVRELQMSGRKISDVVSNDFAKALGSFQSSPRAFPMFSRMVVSNKIKLINFFDFSNLENDKQAREFLGEAAGFHSRDSIQNLVNGQSSDYPGEMFDANDNQINFPTKTPGSIFDKLSTLFVKNLIALLKK